MKNKKLVKIALIIIAAIILLGAIAAVLIVNWHNIFLFCEEKGFFCREIEISRVDGTYISDNFTLTTYGLLLSDERVKLDQSLMLVNTEHMLPEDFEPQVSEYKDTTVYMNNCMLEAYASLSAAVTERTGKKLYVSSDLRSAEEQMALYEEDPLTATLPGASEHQTGLALDLNSLYKSFGETAEGKWLAANSQLNFTAVWYIL